MTFHDTWTSVEHRFSLGIESDAGRHYLSIPVSSGIVDYVEFYEQQITFTRSAGLPGRQVLPTVTGPATEGCRCVR